MSGKGGKGAWRIRNDEYEGVGRQVGGEDVGGGVARGEMVIRLLPRNPQRTPKACSNAGGTMAKTRRNSMIILCL